MDILSLVSGFFVYCLVNEKKPCNVLKPLDLSLAFQFQLKSVRGEGKELGVVSDKKVDTHSCSIFFKG